MRVVWWAEGLVQGEARWAECANENLTQTGFWTLEATPQEWEDDDQPADGARCLLTLQTQ